MTSENLERVKGNLGQYAGEAMAHLETLEQAQVPMDDRVPAVCSGITLVFQFECGCAGGMGALDSTFAAADGSIDSRLTIRCEGHQDEAHDAGIYAAVMQAWGKALGLEL